MKNKGVAPIIHILDNEYDAFMKKAFTKNYVT